MENLEALLKSHKLTNEDYDHIKKILGREPNLVELGIFSAMWSEHCSYKSSRVYLKGFPTEAPWVIQGPGENAGVIDIGDGDAAVFKMESHNHPSFIEPFQGAATGVGGILRDVFTMGARPVANMNSLRFGDISDKGEQGKLHRHLLRGVVEGISSYGNCMGVPMLAGETTFDECYSGNILVNAFTLGLVKSDEIFYGKAKGIGNSVIYVGSKTGRDGLGGAVMSSDSFGADAKTKRPTVQVGDPFTEKLLLEACLEAFKTGAIIGIQDMGAAGLTSSSFEMASRAGSGMVMWLDKVPMREEGMTPYELMLSESQERMLICAVKGREKELEAIFEKWDLDFAVIGEVTDTGNMVLMWNGEVAGEIPVAPITDEAPCYTRPTSEPKYLSEIANVGVEACKKVSSQEAIESLLAHQEVADKSFIYSQYDSTVQTNSMTKIGRNDAGVIRVKGTNKALAVSVDCNPRQVYINPRLGAAAAVMEAGRNVATTGARPLAITDCLNFGNPENPEVMWQFKEACEGIKEACRALHTPVVSGNVSLYNETNKVSVFPTPSIGMVGLLEDANKLLTNEFKKAGNSVYLIGDTMSEFGGSLYMKVFGNTVAGKHPEVNLSRELTLWDMIIEANKKGLLESAKDLSIGGLAVALAKMCALSSLGFEGKSGFSDERDIFAESLSRVVVEVSKEKEEEFLRFAPSYALKVVKIGEVRERDMKLDSINLSSEKLSELYFESFKKIVEQDL
ncbi:MAG: phosphoribosylformylglycinamidine synthase subunit PurL [Campylobacteraceae bacterium]|nr:phosphoribosylformylglycinamidine synthase subunit PurL [Campylobacteraceae bacterium]